jgi:ATP-dependent exoDNAse (exonuclease V) beta subunit
VTPAAGRAEAPAVALAVPDAGPWTDAIARVRAAVRSPFEGPSAAAEHGGGSGILSGGRDRSIALAAGTAVHALLERWDPREPGALLRDAEGVAGSAAVENGADPGAVLAEVRAALDAFVRSPLSARLARGRILGREVPMLLRREDGTAWKGSIDLLLEEPDRGIVVIDYKTDSEPGGAEERYGPQLAAYVEAVRKALGLAQPPRAELWMVRSGSALPVAT